MFCINFYHALLDFSDGADNERDGRAFRANVEGGARPKYANYSTPCMFQLCVDKCIRRSLCYPAVDEMSRRVDDLERNVSDLMTHAPADLDLPADAATSSAHTSAAASSGAVASSSVRAWRSRRLVGRCAPRPPLWWRLVTWRLERASLTSRLLERSFSGATNFSRYS